MTYPKDREFTFDGSVSLIIVKLNKKMRYVQEVIEFNVLVSATNVTVNARNLTIDATKTTVVCNGEKKNSEYQTLHL